MQKATDQLLISDAVDRVLSQVSFAPLARRKVFLDTQYLRSVRTSGCVDSLYITSAMRELMIRDGCIVMDNREEADFVIEARMGALGTDNHEVNYGVPGSQAVNQTASLLTSTPVPTIPEVSFAKKDERRAAAKLALFAYDRSTRERVWQTGTVLGLSHAKSTWVLGAGPFHEGDIYEASKLGSSPAQVRLANGDTIIQNIHRLAPRSSGSVMWPAKWPRRENEPTQLKPDRFSQQALARESAAEAYTQHQPPTSDQLESTVKVELPSVEVTPTTTSAPQPATAHSKPADSPVKEHTADNHAGAILEDAAA